MSNNNSRKLLRLSGTDPRCFLQTLITNDVKALDNGLVYSALQTAQGKYLADFFLLEQSDGSILIDLPAQIAEAIKMRLQMYILRKPLTLEMTDIRVSRGTGAAPKGAFADPRHPALGWRLYGDKQINDDTDWTALRIAHIIPEYGAELTENSYILEHGFERLNGVNFKKGCYVGQEITARMKHKTELRKGIARLSFDQPVQTGEAIIANGKEIGTVTTAKGTKGLGFLRFDKIDGEITAGAAAVIDITRP